MGSGNVGDDLALVGAWLTVLADLMAAIGATVVVEPASDSSNSTSERLEQQIEEMQGQLVMQKKQLQKQQIQMQLWLLQQELSDIEQQLKARK